MEGVASPYRAATSIVTFTSEGSVSTGARRRCRAPVCRLLAAAQAGSGTASARLTRRDLARAVTRAQPS